MEKNTDHEVGVWDAFALNCERAGGAARRLQRTDFPRAGAG